MVKVPVNPNVLRWARESANLTLDEVANKIKKNQEIIASWENGTDSPSYIQLEKLAYKVYKRPVAVFFFPAPPKEDKINKSFRTLPESEFKKLPSALIKQIRKALVIQENLYELCNDKTFSNPKLLREQLDLQNYDLKKNAANIRSILGISLDEQKSFDSTETALAKWRDAFEEHGIFVFKEAFRNDDYSGFCLYDENFPLIFINNTMPKTRQIFTLFHELGHLLLNTSGIDKMNPEINDYIRALPEPDRKLEVLCNNLAAEILVPSDDFSTHTRGITINDATIADFADIYRVSREVILRKFLDKGLIRDSTYNQFRQKWIANAIKVKQEKRGGGDYYNTKMTYLGDRYLELTFDAYYKKNISDIQLAEYLDVKLDNLPTLELSLHKRWSR